jgi:hypothetical protein
MIIIKDLIQFRVESDKFRCGWWLEKTRRWLKKEFSDPIRIENVEKKNS